MVLCQRRVVRKRADANGGLPSIEEEGIVGKIFGFLDLADGLALSSASRKLHGFRPSVPVRRVACSLTGRWGARFFVSRLDSYPNLDEIVVTGGGLTSPELRILFEKVGCIWPAKKSREGGLRPNVATCGCVCECHLLHHHAGLATLRLEWSQRNAEAGWKAVAAMLKAGGCPTVQTLDLQAAPIVASVITKSRPLHPRGDSYSSREVCSGVAQPGDVHLDALDCVGTVIAKSLLDRVGETSLRRLLLPAGSYDGVPPGMLRGVARLNVADAACELGRRFEEGSHGIAVDALEAEAWYAQAAHLGMADGAFRYGLMSRDRQAARSYLHWAAVRGHGPAQLQLARMCLREQKYSEAKRWLSNACQAGLAEAFSLLGDMHATGMGTKVDPSEAVRLYHIALGMGVKGSAGGKADVSGEEEKETSMGTSLGGEGMTPLSPFRHACVTYQLGAMSLVGRGCPIDRPGAKRMFQCVVEHHETWADLTETMHAGARYFLSLVMLDEFQAWLSSVGKEGWCCHQAQCGSVTTPATAVAPAAPAAAPSPEQMVTGLATIEAVARHLHEAAHIGHSLAVDLLKREPGRALTLTRALAQGEGEGCPKNARAKLFMELGRLRLVPWDP